MTELKRVGIAAIGSYLPEKVLTNEYMESIVDTSDEWITERTGIKERRIVAEGEYNSDMVTNVVHQLLEQSGLEAGDLDHIIVATITSDRPLPATSCYVQAKTGATNAAVFDIQAACSGFLYGLKIAKGLIASGTGKNIIVVGSDVLTSITNWSDRTTCVLFGDGCGGVLLQEHQEGMPELLSTDIGAEGESSELLTIPAGGQSLPLTPELLEKNAHKVIMDGNAIFKKAVRKMVASTRKALEMSGLEQDSLDWLVPHQANKRILLATARGLKIPQESVFMNVHKTGNTSSASVPVALHEAASNGKFDKGNIICMCAFGGGLTWGASVVRW
ncbi:MAG: beta-ketoacyl-ACP synthase III [Planctomycetota bacterium]|nr:beta-ketoacyl-ACP synthase III [Planctomycetota bacterium]